MISLLKICAVAKYWNNNLHDNRNAIRIGSCGRFCCIDFVITDSVNFYCIFTVNTVINIPALLVLEVMILFEILLKCAYVK
jgi:hypothetical protein